MRRCLAAMALLALAPGSARAAEGDDALRWIGTMWCRGTKHVSGDYKIRCLFHKCDMDFHYKEEYLLTANCYVVLREEADERLPFVHLRLDRGTCAWRVEEERDRTGKCRAGTDYERGEFRMADSEVLTEKHLTGFIAMGRTGRRTYCAGLNPGKGVKGTIRIAWQKHMRQLHDRKVRGVRPEARGYAVPSCVAGGPARPTVAFPGGAGTGLHKKPWGPAYLDDDGTEMKGVYKDSAEYTIRGRTGGRSVTRIRIDAGWDLRRMGNVVVEIEPCDKAWRPKKDGTPVSVRARIVEPKGAKGLMRFTLYEVSREAGYCMNAGSGNDPDLEFVPDPATFATPRWKQDEGGKWAEVMQTAGPVSECTVQIQPHDYGAYARLKAEANLSAMWHPAQASNGTQYYVTVPLDEDGNHIADGCTDANKNGEAANADTDRVPEGDGKPGDGLSNYEEYRGFEIKGHWQMTNPDQKDLFICYGERAAGMEHDLFEKATGLAIHEIREQEFNGKGHRVVNFNHGTAHRVDQHGLYVTTEKEYPEILLSGIEGVAVPVSPTRSRQGDPFSPADVKAVVICVPWFADNRGEMSITLAHELGHCVGIEHHGPKDKEVTREWLGKGIVPDGFKQYLDLLDVLRPRESYTMAIYNGAHSGDQKCFMRYSTQADLYQRDDGHIYPYPGDDKVGEELCDSPTGTGLNAPGIRSRTFVVIVGGRPYTITQVLPVSGNAARGRGACKKQIHVSDE